MSVTELIPTVQALPRLEKLRLMQYLADDLARQEEAEEYPPLPENFPPPEDHCPYTREEIDAARREPGAYSLDEMWRSIRHT